VNNDDKLTFSGLSNFTVGDLYMRQGIIDIEGLSMTIFNNLVDDVSESVSFGIDKYIKTNGSHGDGGLIRRIFENGEYLYPIGSEDRYALCK